MFTRILVLAFAIHCSIASHSSNEPVLDALAAHHNIAVHDTSYTAGLQQALGGNVAVHNEPIHFKTGFVGTPSQPLATGQIMNEHVETFALGQQQQRSQAHVTHVVSQPAVHTQTVQTHAVQTQAVQVPVQTMQTVQVPSIQYQTVQVPVQVQREIVQVEKPVPVPHPVRVESPPKPYVKEAIYARPFQMSQQYVKTRITPLEEVTQRAEEITTTTWRPTTTSTTEQPSHNQVNYVDLTEENLYFANRRRKVITRFIKIEEMYEAESTEEVGVFYDFGPSSADDFELKVTRIFEVDQPILVKNETVTSRVSYLRSPTHIIHEYMNGRLVRTHDSASPNGLFIGVNASEAHSAQINSDVNASQFGSPDFHRYTQVMNGREVEIEERTTVLPGGHALFIERRIHAVGDHSPFPESIEPVPSFETSVRNGREVLVLTLTYDSTRRQSHGRYGIAASESFGTEFSNFLSDFRKNIPSRGGIYDRLKRSLEHVESQVQEGLRKKRSVEEPAAIEESVEHSNDAHNVAHRGKRTPQQQIEYHGKMYRLAETVPLKGHHPGGYIYRSEDGQEVRVEEETITHIEGAPRNEYLRYSQVYVPREKVRYEVSGLYGGQPMEPSYFGGLGYNYPNSQNYPLHNGNYQPDYSYRYGSSSSHPFFQH